MKHTDTDYNTQWIERDINYWLSFSSRASAVIRSE